MKKLFLSMLFIAAMAISSFAQHAMPCPMDPNVRVGKLDNGLTYYIRHNEKPSGRADFYIAQKVGSVLEEESQRGLAHFLEHMAFNGTTNLPGMTLREYLQSRGIKFGENLNAGTGIDQTVYMVTNVPTNIPGLVDTCLLILHDWSSFIALEEAEIDNERGVILEELRTREDADERIMKEILPIMYPNSPYANRLPGGLPEVVANFEYQTLRDYYHKWYRPDLQGVVVVGDIDVDQMEQKIKTLFSPIVLPENRALVVKEPVPDNNEPIIVIDKDKEQRYNIVEVMMKHKAMPDSLKGTMAFVLANYMKSAALSMLNDRLKEYAEKPESPFLQASAEDGSYLLSNVIDAFTLGILPKDGQAENALKTALIEARRAAEFGFTATEYSRFKANYLSSLDKQYSNKDKRYNRQFVNQYVQHFLANNPIPSIDFTYANMKQMVPMLPLEGVNMLIKKLVAQTDTNLVVLNFNNEKEGAVYPTEEGLMQAVRDARSAQIEAYVDNVKDEPLLTTLPKKGKIKKIIVIRMKNQ